LHDGADDDGERTVHPAEVREHAVVDEVGRRRGSGHAGGPGGLCGSDTGDVGAVVAASGDARTEAVPGEVLRHIRVHLQVRVTVIDPRVDDGELSPFALRRLVCPLDVQVLLAPLVGIGHIVFGFSPTVLGLDRGVSELRFRVRSVPLRRLGGLHR
jgi:hypothetical protein